MKGSVVFRWLTPALFTVFLSVPVHTVKAGPMGGGHMGGGHMAGGHMAGIGGSRGARSSTSRAGHAFARNHHFERGERFEREEREEHEFFFRHNFFIAFDFGAFGFWPWWWGWDGWWYPPYDGYSPYDSQTNDSQTGAEYWNQLAISVQTKLADQGYYHGQVDGVIGSDSMAAIRRFQAKHGLPATGRIDPKLLKALGISYKAVAKA